VLVCLSGPGVAVVSMRASVSKSVSGSLHLSLRLKSLGLRPKVRSKT